MFCMLGNGPASFKGIIFSILHNFTFSNFIFSQSLLSLLLYLLCFCFFSDIFEVCLSFYFCSSLPSLNISYYFIYSQLYWTCTYWTRFMLLHRVVILVLKLILSFLSSSGLLPNIILLCCLHNSVSIILIYFDHFDIFLPIFYCFKTSPSF